MWRRKLNITCVKVNKKLPAEKTEVLSEDLLQVEKRLELVKQVTHSTHKKLTACLQGQQGADVDKRSVRSPSKKLPLMTLAQCLVEGAAVLGDESLLGKMLNMCGETEDRLAQELILFELQIERDVIEPLFILAEMDIPNIQKQRKHLAKLVLDMDSARTRWQQSSKSSGMASNLQPSGAKADALREEMEEAANRVDICRDQLSADMYNFVAKEIDYASYFQTLIEVQADYHSKSLALLQSILPQIKAHQEAWIEKPSYGKALEEHLAISGREIAFPIEACVTMLLECGMQEEGLFRVAPSASKLKKLKASLDCGVLDVQEYSADPHAIAGALKSYLRELPEPLMTFELYDEWIQASNIQDQDKRLQALLNACEQLPKANADNLRYLIKFLAKLTEYQDSNKMTPGNIAIVLGPNLLWTHTEGNITEMMTTVSLQIVGIIEPIIQHADWFFPGEIEFNVTGNYGSPLHTNHNANYSSMPSPDLDHSDRKLHDQTRRPLSVATDNMMLEFYKKDGIRKIQSMGVRVMDTSWVSRRGSSLVRKTASTPLSVQPPAPPAELDSVSQCLLPEQPYDLSASPSPTPPPSSGGTDRASTDDVSSNWSDSCYAYPSPEDDRPPPPYPTSYLPPRHYYPKAQPSSRPAAPTPLDPVTLGSSPHRWTGYSPPLPPPSPSPQQLDINSNPKPSFLHLPKQNSLTDAPHAAPETNVSPLYIKTPLVLTKQDPLFGTPPNLPMSASPQWVSCTCTRERGTKLTSTLKSKELSPVMGQKGSCPGLGSMTSTGSGQQGSGIGQQLTSDQSPHSLRKGTLSKKLAPIPPKVPFGQSGAVSDQSTGQPSPVSLSPTPPSTPSPYGLTYPQGYTSMTSPGQVSPAAPQSLSSPSSLTGTLTKSRPTPKPRQRPSLPPPQPPTVPGLPGSSPQSLDHTMLDGMSPGESMSTDPLGLEIPIIHIEFDGLHCEPPDPASRNSVGDFMAKTESEEEEEESESTAL
ncbi:rho GTPase-activating protein 44-like isoform X2 [Acipenser ruthenus]|uniref:rho GTPase-activating protein 44-like isoform X2 n=1 Tax=Acipenser ruthenus TaxID=7906 RepID=UPI00274132A8|nr:rho GTPase-activating protein 44-like isoform X2 [Acipenser ruthenus]